MSGAGRILQRKVTRAPPDDVSSDEADTLRGIDGNPLVAPRSAPATLALGEARFDAQSFVVADPPVLEAMGLGAGAGLLGQPFWRGFGRVEVDFIDGVLRLWEPIER